MQHAALEIDELSYQQYFEDIFFSKITVTSNNPIFPDTLLPIYSKYTNLSIIPIFHNHTSEKASNQTFPCMRVRYTRTAVSSFLAYVTFMTRGKKSPNSHQKMKFRCEKNVA